MAEEKPVVYILRGDDREAVETHLRNFYESLGTADMAEMNTTRLDGTSIKINDLRGAALAVPFLSERRLIIVDDALKPYAGRENQAIRQDFLALLESLPESTGLVLLAPDTQKYKGSWDTVKENHWLIKWAKAAGHCALVIDCALPTQPEMPAWIRQKVIEKGGNFTPQAVEVLAEYVGTNTQRAAQEIIKLLTYANYSRPVDDDDVRRLTAQEHQGDIFALVDALGSRNAQKAQEMFHILLRDSDFMQLFGMIVRQFRLLLQAREILNEGGKVKDVAELLNIHAYVAQKVSQQANYFDLGTLEAIYEKLLTIDLDNKTGGMPGDIAMDVLIAQLSGGTG